MGPQWPPVGRDKGGAVWPGELGYGGRRYVRVTGSRALTQQRRLHTLTDIHIILSHRALRLWPACSQVNAAAIQAGVMAQQKARLEHALELRRKLRKLVAGGKLSPEVVEALDKPGPGSKAAAMAIVRKLRAGKGKSRGGRAQKRTEKKQQKQQEQQKHLESFDTASVVTVNEKEMADAWGAIDEDGAASQQ